MGTNLAGLLRVERITLALIASLLFQPTQLLYVGPKATHPVFALHQPFIPNLTYPTTFGMSKPLASGRNRGYGTFNWTRNPLPTELLYVVGQVGSSELTALGMTDP